MPFWLSDNSNDEDIQRAELLKEEIIQNQPLRPRPHKFIKTWVTIQGFALYYGQRIARHAP